ncbi:MAG: LysM peptidoglycan-binding domain-containing protein [Opitutaceae bacterium]|jgi:LysM repeat protein|nr:LysM peptidoglycan-binding domain-containing protein [Opitutaceae bacterium]
MRLAVTPFMLFVALLAPTLLSGQNVSPAVELANMREEFRLLQQRVGALTIRVEQLEEENSRLARSAAGAGQTYATLTQLNTAIADLTRDIRTANAATKSEVLATVATQMENLARQTNAALDSVTRTRTASAPAAPATFSDNFPKDGITYTVAAGDTISRIAQKTGAKVSDIINANRLADPTRIQVGQVLFIPGGK